MSRYEVVVKTVTETHYKVDASCETVAKSLVLKGAIDPISRESKVDSVEATKQPDTRVLSSIRLNTEILVVAEKEDRDVVTFSGIKLIIEYGAAVDMFITDHDLATFESGAFFYLDFLDDIANTLEAYLIDFDREGFWYCVAFMNMVNKVHYD
jgi:hypothetical protein